MNKVVLFGASSSGKSAVLKSFPGSVKVCDMDLYINTKKKYSPSESEILINNLLIKDFSVYCCSVNKSLIFALHERVKNENSITEILLHVRSKTIWKSRLMAQPTLGKKRKAGEVKRILSSDIGLYLDSFNLNTIYTDYINIDQIVNILTVSFLNKKRSK